MSYRIKAKDSHGNTVTRMDLDPSHPTIENPRAADEIAEAFARSQRSNGQWQGRKEYYDKSIANPKWDREQGGIDGYSGLSRPKYSKQPKK